MPLGQWLIVHLKKVLNGLLIITLRSLVSITIYIYIYGPIYCDIEAVFLVTNRDPLLCLLDIFILIDRIGSDCFIAFFY